MKINNQIPLNIAIIGHGGRVIATANNCRFMSFKALITHLNDQAMFLKHKAQDQALAHLRPVRALIMSNSNNFTINF